MPGLWLGTRHLLEDALGMLTGEPLDADRRAYVASDLASTMGPVSLALAGVRKGLPLTGAGIGLREASRLARLMPQVPVDEIGRGAGDVAATMGFILRDEPVPPDLLARSGAFLHAMLDAVRSQELLAPAPSSA